MATYTNDGQIVIKDSDGNKHIVNPFTRDENVSLDTTLATALGLTGDAVVADALAKLSGAALRKTVTLSNMPDGTLFVLNETIGGTTAAVTFVKLKNDYEGSGRVLVVRKDGITASVWNGGGTNAYSGSTIDAYLSSTYFNYLDSAVRASVKDVEIPHTPGNGNSAQTTLARKCFALSVTEMCGSHANANVEGSNIPYFSTAGNRLIKNGGASVGVWLRTPDKASSTNAFRMGSNGTTFTADVVTSGTPNILPAFTLPADYKVSDPNDPTKYNSITDMLGNDFPLPYAKIATGSYTGTGTFGSSNKNTLTFEAVPKFLFISRALQENQFAQVHGTSSYYAFIPYFLLVDRPGSPSYFRSVEGASGYDCPCTISNGGKTISWHSTSVFAQLNATNIDWVWIAIY